MKNLLYVFFGIFSLFFTSCIPIDDRIEPIIAPKTMPTAYYWQDTLNIAAIITDNNKLESVIVAVKPLDVTSSWVINEKIQLNGRKYDLDFKKIIPLTAAPGVYLITLTCQDTGGNIRIYTFKFEVLGDIRAPYFGEVKPINLKKLDIETYLGCRSQAVLFEGYLKDNIGLGSLTVEFEGYPRIVYNLNGQDSIDINALLHSDVRIPQSIPDGKKIALNLFCVDTDGNLSKKTLYIYVDCDDIKPVLTLNETYPKFDAGRVTVIQGTDFVIEDALASDNRYLKDVTIIFNKRGAAKDTVFHQPIEKALEADLTALFGKIAITMPAAASPGDRYDFFMFVRDSANLTSDVFYLEMITGRDEPPLILLTNTQKNDLEQDWTTTSNNIVASGDRLRIDGKILEDVALDYLKITWGTINDQKLVVDLDSTELLGRLPFNLADPISKNTFDIADKIVTPSNNLYKLTIETKDKKNEAVKKVYTFRVQ